MNTGLSKRNLWAYPVGSVGRDMAVGMFTGYLLTYVLFTKKSYRSTVCIIECDHDGGAGI